VEIDWIVNVEALQEYLNKKMIFFHN